MEGRDDASQSADVFILGGIKIVIGNASASDEFDRSRKMLELLAYFIVHHGRSLSPSEIIDALWPDEESFNPAGTLKTLLYRTRAVLAQVFGEEIEIIRSYRGSYSWNPDIPCVVDLEEFERLCGQAESQGLDDAQRIIFYRQAVELYKGDFLPKLSSEMWVVPISIRYHSMYVNAVKRYGVLLEEAGNFQEMEQVVSKALQLEAYDEELYCMLVQSQLRQGRNTDALASYENATQVLYRSLGTKPSENLRALYREMMKTQKSLETDLGVIQDALMERAEQPGVFVCDYGFFMEAYRLEARRAIRSGACVHLCLLTVSTSSGKTPDLEALERIMEHLLKCIEGRLRRGDIVSRYSGAQYIMMLPNANAEDSEMVVRHVLSSFRQRCRNKEIEVHYKVQPMELN